MIDDTNALRLCVLGNLDLSLLEKWVNGHWPEEDFLVVRPGEEIEPTYNDKIIGIKQK